MNIVEMAVIAGQSMTTMPTKFAMKTGTVLAAFEVSKKAKRNSFQENRKTMMETVVMAGLLSGRIILLKAWNLVAPSTSAARSSSTGMSSKYPISIQIAKDRLKARYAMISEKTVS